MSVLECDITLFTLLKKKSVSMPHDELYYALLDWADQHKDIRDAVAKAKDSYTVNYIKLNNDSGSQTFTRKDWDNPFLAARRYYARIYDECSVMELWHDPNPALGIGGRSKLLLYKE